ncbi:hypothetical protein Acr_03g0012830 [Actinidia rufa]|uniref:WIYLD domain-containing protein n=1 Tax=Actinidia rufa TaxID=165716 RepID=A0A7J0EF73_9ERIC|nr:hypothetical protein Acr_03g0012830 [Actinidia rufa]
MAPRGRPRKRRLMRMDAAVDHMGLYGFPEELVRGSVKSLLKEYGGDDGWPFIEENGYMVLLNDILKEQDERIAGENSNEEENLLLTAARLVFVRAGRYVRLPLAIAPHPSSRTVILSSLLNNVSSEVTMALARTLPVFSSVCTELRRRGPPSLLYSNNSVEDVAPGDEIPGDNFVAADAGPSSLVRLPMCFGVANNATQTMETEVRGHLLAAEGGGKGQTDIASDQNCNEKDMVVASGNNELSAQTMELDNTPVQLSPFVVPSATPSNDLPIRSRKPCFGWISNDEEEADFIKLIPAKPASRPENRDSGTVKKPKRKTRWDEGPNDMIHCNVIMAFTESLGTFTAQRKCANLRPNRVSRLGFHGKLEFVCRVTETETEPESDNDKILFLLGRAPPQEPPLRIKLGGPAPELGQNHQNTNTVRAKAANAPELRPQFDDRLPARRSVAGSSAYSLTQRSVCTSTPRATVCQLTRQLALQGTRRAMPYKVIFSLRELSLLGILPTVDLQQLCSAVEPPHENGACENEEMAASAESVSPVTDQNKDQNVVGMLDSNDTVNDNGAETKVQSVSVDTNRDIPS